MRIKVPAVQIDWALVGSLLVLSLHILLAFGADMESIFQVKSNGLRQVLTPFPGN